MRRTGSAILWTWRAVSPLSGDWRAGGPVEPAVNNSVSLKTLRDKSASGHRTSGGIRLWGCIEPDMGTFAAGNFKKGKKRPKHSPGHNKNRAAPVTWNLHNTDISPPLQPTFDLWSLSRRQRFPLPDTSFFFLSHVSYFTAPSFSCRARQPLRGLDCSTARCDSSNALRFIKDILLAWRGKKIPEQPPVAPGLPSKPTLARPHQRWGWKSQDERGQPYAQYHFHLSCLSCAAFSSWYTTDCCSRMPVSCADGVLWCLMSRFVVVGLSQQPQAPRT